MYRFIWFVSAVKQQIQLGSARRMPLCMQKQSIYSFVLVEFLWLLSLAALLPVYWACVRARACVCVEALYKAFYLHSVHALMPFMDAVADIVSLPSCACVVCVYVSSAKLHENMWKIYNKNWCSCASHTRSAYNNTPTYRIQSFRLEFFFWVPLPQLTLAVLDLALYHNGS